MSKPMRRCPSCKTRFVRPGPQYNLIEGALGLLTIYPTRCQICAHRFLTFKGRYHHIPQRNYQRIPVQFPAWLYSANACEALDSSEEGTVVNLSVGGCRVDGMLRAPEGRRLRLQFEIDADEAPVMVEEAVVRSHRGSRTGLSFIKLKDAEKRRIGRLVRGKLSRLWFSDMRSL